jgi:hypothetical protein
MMAKSAARRQFFANITTNTSHGCKPFYLNVVATSGNKPVHGTGNILPIERCAIRFTMKPAIIRRSGQYRRRRKWLTISTGSAF